MYVLIYLLVLIVGTACIQCQAGIMQLTSVCPSVPSQRSSFHTAKLQATRQRWHGAAARRSAANAGSATFTAKKRGWTGLCLSVDSKNGHWLTSYTICRYLALSSFQRPLWVPGTGVIQSSLRAFDIFPSIIRCIQKWNKTFYYKRVCLEISGRLWTAKSYQTNREIEKKVYKDHVY